MVHHSYMRRYVDAILVYLETKVNTDMLED